MTLEKVKRKMEDRWQSDEASGDANCAQQSAVPLLVQSLTIAGRATSLGKYPGWNVRRLTVFRERLELLAGGDQVRM